MERLAPIAAEILVTNIERTTEGVLAPVTVGRGRMLALTAAILVVACAGKSKPEAEAPQREEKSYYDDTSTPATHTEESGGDSEGSPGSENKVSNTASSEPVFTEGMSVDQAIRAVPSGIERRNIDQETLGKPLQDLALYEPCKPGSARVKLRVAVWDGKAVGIDLSVTPKNDKLASCIKGKIAEVTWDKKVKSLNTIEYQF